MAGLFHVIEGAQGVLRQKGVFKQVPLYERDGDLAAKWGGGFIMLKANGGTAHPDVLWDHIEGPRYHVPRLGNLKVTPPTIEHQP